MVRRSVARVLAGVPAVALLVAASPASMPGSDVAVAFVRPAVEQPATQTYVIPPVTTIDQIDIPPEERQDLQMLAEQLGISIAEAIEQSGWQSVFATATDMLERSHDSYVDAGIWQGRGDYRAWVAFEGAAPADLAAVLTGVPVPVQVREHVGWRMADGLAAQGRIHNAIYADPCLFTDVTTGGPDSTTAEIRATVSPPEGVSVRETKRKLRAAATAGGELTRAIESAPPALRVVIEVGPGAKTWLPGHPDGGHCDR